LFGFADPRLAEIKQGNFERDGNSTVSNTFACFLVLCYLVGVTRFQNVDEPGGVGEAISPRERIEFNSCNLKVNAPADGLLLYCGQGKSALRESGKRSGQNERKIFAPQTERANQALALP